MSTDGYKLGARSQARAEKPWPRFQQRPIQHQLTRGLEAGPAATEVHGWRRIPCAVHHGPGACTAAAAAKTTRDQLLLLALRITQGAAPSCCRLPSPKGRSRSCVHVYAAALCSGPGCVQQYASYEKPRHLGGLTFSAKG